MAKFSTADWKLSERGWFEYYKDLGYEEIWKDAVGLKGIEASSYGRFRDKVSKEIIETKVNSHGRFMIRDQFSYRVIAFTFVKGYDPKTTDEADHIIEDKSNNSMWNLQWVSESVNKSKMSRERKPANAIAREAFYNYIKELRNNPSLKEEWFYFNDNCENYYRYSSFGAFEKYDGNEWKEIAVGYNSSTRYFTYSWTFNGIFEMEYAHRLSAFCFLNNDAPEIKERVCRLKGKTKWQCSIYDVEWRKGRRNSKNKNRGGK